jgi:hypothetical protein
MARGLTLSALCASDNLPCSSPESAAPRSGRPCLRTACGYARFAPWRMPEHQPCVRGEMLQLAAGAWRVDARVKRRWEISWKESSGDKRSCRD